MAQTKATLTVLNVDQYRVEDYGVVTEGADISAALKATIEAAAAARNAVVILPQGDYQLDSLVDAAFPSSGSSAPVHTLTIKGDGCTLHIPSSNTTGGIKITKYNNNQNIRIKDLLILSEAAIGSHGDPTNGIGLHLYSNIRPGDPGWGAGYRAEAILENVEVVSSDATSTGRWDTGILIDGFFFPEVIGGRAATAHPGDDTGTDYETGAGLHFNDCFAPVARGFMTNGRWKYGILVDETGDLSYEDVTIEGCIIVSGYIGVAVQMSSAGRQAASLKEPGGRIIGNHINGHRYAIYIGDRRDLGIYNNHLYVTVGSGKYEYTDESFICVHDSQNITAKGNLIMEGGYYTSDTETTRHFYLTGTSTGCSFDDNDCRADGIVMMSDSSGTNRGRNNRTQGYDAPNNSGPTKDLLVNSGTVYMDDVVHTLTPTITFGGGATGVTYTTQTGNYVRHGPRVSGGITLELLTKGSSTGDFNIVTGLPIPSGSYAGVTIHYANNFAQGPIGGNILANGNIELFHLNGTDNLNQNLDNADLNNTSSVRLSFDYVTSEV